jgi:uncharacterized protein with von Willebrand factor type A (vWA) domain
MTYPAGDLAANVVAFCDRLRREHGFGLGTGESLDAVRAVEAVGVGDRGGVRLALSLVCCATADEQAAFPGLFQDFFFPGPPGIAQRQMPAPDQPAVTGAEAAGAGPRTSGAPEAGDELGDGAPGSAAEARDAGTARVDAAVAAARYSPAAGSAPPPAVPVPGPAMLAAAARLLARLRLGRSRRLRPMARGHRFDLRRTLRANLAYGGELIHPRLIGRPPRHPRVVVLIDGSRSMAPHAEVMLEFAAALARRTDRVDAFVFSTRLARVTQALRHGTLPDLGEAWGGGTRIGACMAAFAQGEGDRLLGPETLVVIASDGLDVGDPDTLREAMRTIHRRSCAVVWVNPLADLAGYEPAARGMQAALPYVTTLGAAHDADGFARLAAAVRLRR